MRTRWLTCLLAPVLAGALLATPAGAIKSHKLVNVVLPAGEAPSAITGAGTTLYVANTLSNSLTVINAGSARVVGTRPLSSSPTAVFTSGPTIWVAMTNGTVARYSTKTWHRQLLITAAQTPIALVVSGKRLWIADAATNTIVVASTVDGHVIGSFSSGGTGLSSLLMVPGHLLATNATSGEVQEFDPATGDLQGTFAVRQSPVGMTLVGSTVWVVRATAHTVAVLDLAGGAISAYYPTAGLKTTGITAVGNHVLVASSATNLVMDLKASTGKIYRGHRTGRGPTAMCFLAGRLWVTNLANRSVDGITL